MDLADIVKAVVEERELDGVLQKHLEGWKEDVPLGKFVVHGYLHQG